MPLRSLLAFLLILLLTTGCTEPYKPFRVGSNVWIGYESLYLARALGQFDGTPIQLVEMNNATEVSNALRAGVLEGAALTLDEVLTVCQDGIDLRVVLIMDFSEGADVLLARPEFPDLESLRSRRIGVESSAVGAILLQEALESAGMSSAEVQVVHLAVDHHVDAWGKDQVDALVTFEPVRTRILQKGAHELFSSRQIPGRILDVLVVRADLDARQQNHLRQLLRGHFAALDVLRQQPLAAARRMAPRTQISEPEVLSSFEGVRIPDLEENRRLLAGDAPDMTASVRRLAEWMLAQQMFRRRVIPEEIVRNLFDDRWLPEKP